MVLSPVGSNDQITNVLLACCQTIHILPLAFELLKEKPFVTEINLEYDHALGLNNEAKYVA